MFVLRIYRQQVQSLSTFRLEKNGLLGCDFRYRHRRFELQKGPKIPKISTMIVMDDLNQPPHFFSIVGESLLAFLGQVEGT